MIDEKLDSLKTFENNPISLEDCRDHSIPSGSDSSDEVDDDKCELQTNASSVRSDEQIAPDETEDNIKFA